MPHHDKHHPRNGRRSSPAGQGPAPNLSHQAEPTALARRCTVQHSSRIYSAVHRGMCCTLVLVQSSPVLFTIIDAVFLCCVP